MANMTDKECSALAQPTTNVPITPNNSSVHSSSETASITAASERRDDVVKRMLATPPKPKASPSKGQPIKQGDKPPQ